MVVLIGLDTLIKNPVRTVIVQAQIMFGGPRCQARAMGVEGTRVRRT